VIVRTTVNLQKEKTKERKERVEYFFGLLLADKSVPKISLTHIGTYIPMSGDHVL